MRGATGRIRLAELAAGFQSTLLMRGATRQRKHIIYFSMISIHAPHARSDVYCSFLSSYNCISIHAPHARSDVGKIYWRHQKEISIHAPHARSDATTFCMDAVVSNFNPRSSCEERPDVLLFTNHRDIFQSTLLMRGATPCWFSYIVL